MAEFVAARSLGHDVARYERWRVLGRTNRDLWHWQPPWSSESSRRSPPGPQCRRPGLSIATLAGCPHVVDRPDRTRQWGRVADVLSEVHEHEAAVGDPP